MKVSNYNSNYIQQTTYGSLMKNILKREYYNGKHVSQVIYQIFFISLILILRLFFLVNFPEKKLSKIKSNKENVLVLYRKLHNLYQSLHFLLKLKV